MAKKTKRTKRSKRKSSRLPVTVEPDCEVTLELTDAVLKEPEMVRRLGHRVVDMLADTGRYDDLAECMSGGLGCLVDDFVIDRVMELIEEARAAGKGVPRG